MPRDPDGSNRMLNHLGYLGMCLSIEAATNRTCRLKNASPERLRELIESNLGDLERALRFNAENSIRLYRVSSDLIPFASHPINTIPWWDEQAERFEAMAAIIRDNDIRTTMHPGQFTVLNSPNPKVVESAREEIAWHCRLLDCLGAGQAGKIVIHIGGAFGDKPAAKDRFVEVANALPESHRRRLVIENDEHVYSVEDVLELSERTGLPMIYDNLHDAIHSKRSDGPARWLPEVFKTWSADDGVPKVHFSGQAIGERMGYHSDFIDPDEFASYLAAAPRETPFDCMLECKRKDLALVQLRGELAERGIVEAASA